MEMRPGDQVPPGLNFFQKTVSYVPPCVRSARAVALRDGLDGDHRVGFLLWLCGETSASVVFFLLFFLSFLLFFGLPAAHFGESLFERSFGEKIGRETRIVLAGTE